MRDSIIQANYDYDEDRLEEEINLLKNIELADKKLQDTVERKRNARASIKRRGGIRQESPFFDDD